MKSNGKGTEWEEAWDLFRTLTTEELIRMKQAFRRPIFYQSKTSRKRTFWCPECGEYELERGNYDIYVDDSATTAKHRDVIDCPICGYRGELICLGRIRNFATVGGIANVMWFFERDGWLLAMAGYAMMPYSHEDLDPLPRIDWNARYAMRPGKRMMWRDGQNYGGNFRGGETRYRQTRWSEPFPQANCWNWRKKDAYAIFGLREAIGNSELRWCGLETVWTKFVGANMEDGDESNYVIRYLGLYTQQPQIEMLVKSGLWEPVKHRLLTGHHGEWDWRAKTPWGFLRLDRQEYNLYRAAELKPDEIKAYRESTMKLCDYCQAKILYGAYLIEAMRLYGADTKRFRRISRWYAGQKEKNTDENTWALWRDTLSMEKRLGNDVTHDDVLMPADLQARHDECLRLIREQEERKRRQRQMEREEREREEQREYEKKRLKRLRKLYEYGDGDVCIRIPRGGHEIVREGDALHHCVAGYADRHIRGIKCILFLRWEDDPDTPYVTIELDEKQTKIVQIYGFHDDNLKYGKEALTAKPRKIHGDFLDEWLDWVRAGSPRLRNGRPYKTQKEETA